MGSKQLNSQTILKLILLCSLGACQAPATQISASSLPTAPLTVRTDSEGTKGLQAKDGERGKTELQFDSGPAQLQLVAQIRTGSEGTKDNVRTGSEGTKFAAQKTSSFIPSTPQAMMIYEVQVGKNTYRFLVTENDIASDGTYTIQLTGLVPHEKVKVRFDSQVQPGAGNQQIERELEATQAPNSIQVAQIPVPVDAQGKPLIIRKNLNPRALVVGDDSSFVDDLSVPDNTGFNPGERFEKVWAIQNAGNVIWQANERRLVNLDTKTCIGDGIIVPDMRSIPIPQTFPGQILVIRVNMTAPMAPGVYRSTWKQQDNTGRNFFPGLNGIYTQIKVPKESPEQAGDLIITPPPNNKVVQINAVAEVKWQLRNNTDKTLRGSKLVNTDKNICPGSGFLTPTMPEISIPDISPGQEIEVKTSVRTPSLPGTIHSTWKVVRADGSETGQLAQVQLTVEQPLNP